MLTINVRGVKVLVDNFNEFTANQAPFAMAKALTATARDAQQAATEHVKQAFDQPTTFTQRAIAFTPANKVDLIATVFVKDIQASYLVAEIDGGTRGFKSFEDKFGGSEFAMPGKDVKRNQFGNMSKAQIVKVASGVSANGGGQNYFRAQSKKNSNVSIIYARTASNAKLIPQLVFVKRAAYKPKFMFTQVVQQTVDAKFTENFQTAWAAAIASMKR